MKKLLKISLTLLLISAATCAILLLSRNSALLEEKLKKALQPEERDTRVEESDAQIETEEEPEEAPLSEESSERLKEKAEEALAFCKSNNYNTDFSILIDMKIHSGKHRLFVYDFNRQKIERKSLCAHGSGKGNRLSTGEQPLFGNVEGSLLTSLGKYEIGARAYSNWGINVHYKLHGLDTSNSNAFKRIIVLHSYTPIPVDEMYPLHLPRGWSQGCPVIDDETMTYLDVKLKDVEKPVLLWIYY